MVIGGAKPVIGFTQSWKLICMGVCEESVLEREVFLYTVTLYLDTP